MTVLDVLERESTAEPVSPLIMAAVSQMQKSTSMRFVPERHAGSILIGAGLEPQETPAMSVYAEGAVLYVQILSEPEAAVARVFQALDAQLARLDTGRFAEPDPETAALLDLALHDVQSGGGAADNLARVRRLGQDISRID